MSIKKVANLAGVSIATVSRYFNNPDKVSKKTQGKVQSAIDKINYSPNALAQNLRRGKTGLIIAVVPKISSSLYEPITKQLNRVANEHGYNLLVKEANFNSLTLDYFKNMIRCKQADGFIILAGLSPQAHQYHNNEQLPIVLACEPHQFTKAHHLPHLAIDYRQAAKEATAFLIKNGHESIAFIARDYNSASTQEQQRGYTQAMDEATSKTTRFTINVDEYHLNLKEKLNILLRSDTQPTAIFCADDETAIEIMHWVKANGLKVPNDISIMGFHNTHFSEICDPPLTTVNNPMSTIGTQAMEILFNIINSHSIETNTTPFHHEIIVRESTSQPKRSP